jgi:hypothetical protein
MRLQISRSSHFIGCSIKRCCREYTFGNAAEFVSMTKMNISAFTDPRKLHLLAPKRCGGKSTLRNAMENTFCMENQLKNITKTTRRGNERRLESLNFQKMRISRSSR